MTYSQIRNAIFHVLAMRTVGQQDAHVLAWLDYHACNANELRDRIPPHRA
jgi:hypothetical protein